MKKEVKGNKIKILSFKPTDIKEGEAKIGRTVPHPDMNKVLKVPVHCMFLSQVN